MAELTRHVHDRPTPHAAAMRRMPAYARTESSAASRAVLAVHMASTVTGSIHAIDRLWLRLWRFASGLRELRDVWLTRVCGRCYGVPIRLGRLPNTCSVGGRSLA